VDASPFGWVSHSKPWNPATTATKSPRSARAEIEVLNAKAFLGLTAHAMRTRPEHSQSQSPIVVATWPLGATKWQHGSRENTYRDDELDGLTTVAYWSKEARRASMPPLVSPSKITLPCDKTTARLHRSSTCADE